MAGELKKKVALVTGGTSGIGESTAVLFAEAGAKVVIAGRRETEGNAVVEQIRKAGREATFIKTDVGKAAEVQALVQKTIEKYGRLDIAFAAAEVAAGLPEGSTPFTSEKDLQRLAASWQSLERRGGYSGRRRDPVAHCA